MRVLCGKSQRELDISSVCGELLLLRDDIRQGQPTNLTNLHVLVTTIAKEQGMLAELWHNMMHSTPQGVVGVGLIGIYFVVIVSTAFYRIKKGEHLDHH